MDTKQGNKLIAEFMGYKHDKSGFTVNSEYIDANGHHHSTSYTRKNLDYDKDWNLLMIAVQKVASLNVVHTRFLYTLIINAQIDKVWSDLIGFIQWYNSLDK